MIRNLAPLVLVAALITGCTKYVVNGLPPSNTQQADDLARNVANASGAQAWDRVNTLTFTFVLREGNEVKLSRNHVWDLKANTDTITVNDKSVILDLCKACEQTPEQLSAHKAFIHDIHWLLAPLKLFDEGVTRTYLGKREIQGKEYQVLGLSYATPDAAPVTQYNLYIDPYTNLVAYWDELISPENVKQGTWESYRHPAGLKIATKHQIGTKSITMENLTITTD